MPDISIGFFKDVFYKKYFANTVCYMVYSI